MRKIKWIALCVVILVLAACLYGLLRLFPLLLSGSVETIKTMADVEIPEYEEEMAREEEYVPELGVDQDYDAPDDPDATEKPKEDVIIVQVDKEPEELEAIIFEDSEE